jgi:hypothetical protein
MAEKTIYQCDRCGATVEAKALFNLYISMESVGRYAYNVALARMEPIKTQWCRDCCDLVGAVIVVTAEPRQPDAPPAPTPEELLTAIIRDLVRAEVNELDRHVD